jgi:hypothetical protein
VDSALTVRLVPLVERTAEEWHAAWEQALDHDATLRGLIEEALPESQAQASRYGVEVTLWNAASQRRVWAGRTEAHTKKELRKGAGGLVQSVMDALKLARLL